MHMTRGLAETIALRRNRVTIVSRDRVLRAINNCSKSSTILTAIDTHVACEPARIVVDGVPSIPGRTMAEKKEYVKANLDYLRRALVWEPRGHQGMFAALLTDPTEKEANIGAIFVDNIGYLNACIHACMGIVTAEVALETLNLEQPSRGISIDTPSGLMKARARVRNGKAKDVVVRNVPSFFYKSENVDVDGGGKVPIDISYGGNFFAIVDAERIGLRLDPHSLRELLRFGSAIKEAVNRQVVVRHPLNPGVSGVDQVMITERPSETKPNYRNIVIGSTPGACFFDRSPCGTGTCARMAMLYAKGQLGLHEEFVHESIVGSQFRGVLVDKVRVGGLEAVIPEITGSGYVTAICHFVVDPEDPVRHGFSIDQVK